MTEVYKIIEKGNEGIIKTLYYGIDGSRTLPLNMWIKADKKMVKDGSGGTPYMSGIHCFGLESVARKYFRRFKKIKNRSIIKCEARGFEHKMSNRDVLLADEIYISSKNEF